ncbi:hypothetical protein NHX12_003166 [Muraenolepis orangiensis]|uniref:Uncharacterized protein n=1 Tax=Muraenolepis orangiensis TaxID=630683 RepID=A0A9Q0E0V3_9TELE|nr:hypothetical protein NHX12_003166 [Muraenolepis orangiensis]
MAFSPHRRRGLNAILSLIVGLRHKEERTERHPDSVTWRRGLNAILSGQQLGECALSEQRESQLVGMEESQKALTKKDWLEVDS